MIDLSTLSDTALTMYFELLKTSILTVLPDINSLDDGEVGREIELNPAFKRLVDRFNEVHREACLRPNLILKEAAN